MSSPPKSRTKSWAASQSFDSLSVNGQSSRHKRLQALTRPGKGTSTHHRDRTHRSSRVASERNDDNDAVCGSSGGANSGRLRMFTIAVALMFGFLGCIGVYQFVLRGLVAKMANRPSPVPTPAPTPTPTVDTWAPPAIVIVLREASSQQVTATHGAHLLHATVHRALAASPRSKVAILHNAPAHMGHGEPLERLAKDFAPSVQLFSAVSRDASPRQAFVSRHCNRARYNQFNQEGHSYATGMHKTSTGSLCASQAFRRLLTAADFLDSHSEEWMPESTSAVLLVEPGTLLFFGEDHLKKLALRLPRRKGVLTSLEGLNYDLKQVNRDDNSNSNSSSVSSSRSTESSSWSKHRSLSGNCGVNFDPALRAATSKQLPSRKAGQARALSSSSSAVATARAAAVGAPGGVQAEPMLLPVPFDVGAPAVLATLGGLHGLLGAAARALVRDLALTEPAGASWWLEPSNWFNPEDNAAHAAASAAAVDTKALVPKKSSPQMVSAFSGDAWAQFLADVPATAQLPHTLDLVADGVSRRCSGLLRHTNASIHLSRNTSSLNAAAASASGVPVSERTSAAGAETEASSGAHAATASSIGVEEAAAAGHILPGDLTERRWRRFLGFFERQLSSGPLLRKGTNHGSSSHTRKEWVTKTPDGKRVEHVKFVKTVHRKRPLPDPQLAIDALDGALKWSCTLAMVHPEQLALASSSFSDRGVDSSSGGTLSSSSQNPDCKPGLLPALSCLPLAATKSETTKGASLELAPDAFERTWLVPIAVLPLSRALVASAQGAALWHHSTSNPNNPHLHKLSHHYRHHHQRPDSHDHQHPNSLQPNTNHQFEGGAQSVERAAHGLEFGILTDQFTLPKKGKWGKAIRTRSAGVVGAPDIDQDTAAILSQFIDHDC